MDSIKEYLDSKVEFYNRPQFIESDPVLIPHLFTAPEDIEIAGFLAATLAWGQRKTIIRKARELMLLMENSPYEFIINSKEKDFSRFENFCHRTFNATDTLYFLNSLKNIYMHKGGLKTIFTRGFMQNNHAREALGWFRMQFFDIDFPFRTAKHVPDVSKGSSAKRLNMFLRWMARNDSKGVDFGIWKEISPSWLSVPLDLHSGRTARKLGLLNRKYDDWQAVEELTNRLREFDKNDPVKYDFALFGISIFEEDVQFKNLKITIVR